ncbi:hypothetical protein FSP39_019481 [Pinctada imbricata]|uniref:Uncharacterized protein n=1 Tax=Pinctada imbricata TaxID=66713 RepID=A0AA88YBX3_PINIB|nr:hypothetical protein FSP39_019481 [Pinctada imbricata]
MNNYIKEDYKGLSTLMVFIEQAQFDASSNRVKDMSSIVTKYNEITTKLMRILCELSKVLGGSFESLSHVSGNIMPEHIRNVRGCVEEFTRDFIILSNAESYLTSLLPYYVLLQ